MKKFLTYIPFMAAMMIVACSDNDIAGLSAIEDTTEKAGILEGTMVNVADYRDGGGDSDPMAKSQTYYDRIAKDMKFTWVAGDKIAVFADENDEQQIDFVVDDTKPYTYNGRKVTAVFKPVDEEAAYPIVASTKYYSYFPAKAGDFEDTEVPISLSGQTQEANEQMDYYYLNTEESKALFLESSRVAGRHLAAYDYMTSNATSTPTKYVQFTYEHMTAVVRFMMYCPSTADDDVYYDSLQVYNSSTNFFIEGTMNIKTKELTHTRQSHVASLRFYPAIDMTNNTDDSKPSYHYWRSTGNKKGYIMAYMRVAPIDLTGVDEQCTLYLLGKKPSYYTWEEYKEAKSSEISETDFNALSKIDKMKIYETMGAYNAAVDPDVDDATWSTMTNIDKMRDYTRKVYKAEGLSKQNFEAGYHYQWSVASAPEDDPIEFNLIEIQEWKDGPGFTNENGTGTEDW